MNTFTTDGLVLSVRHTGESDRIVTVLTRDFGVVRAFAKAACRPKSKLHAGTQTFCFSDFSFSENKETYRVTEAAPKELFYHLNDRLAALTLAQYFGQLACELVFDDDKNPEFLRLVLNSLYFLCTREKSDAWIKAVTELRFCSLSGYAPELNACAKCGKTDADRFFFHPSEGVLYCQDCNHSFVGLPLDSTVLGAMRHIVYSNFEQIYSFPLSAESCKKLSLICEKYILCQTERSYTSLDFYKKCRDG